MSEMTILGGLFMEEEETFLKIKIETEPEGENTIKYKRK